MKKILSSLTLIFTLLSCTAADNINSISTQGLILDLNADEGLTLEEGSYISNWKNQVTGFPAKDFIKRDKGRKVAGTGRPTLKKNSPEPNGHCSIIFKESELITMK